MKRVVSRCLGVIAGVVLIAASPARALYFSGQPNRVFDVGRPVGGMALADFNGDGQLDAALCDNGDPALGMVHIMPGRGGGAFGPDIMVPMVSSHYIVTADFNGDGRPDLAELTTTSIAVCLNLGNGNFDLPKFSPMSSPGTALAAADFGKDGRIDLVVAASNVITVYTGDGAGGFTAGPSQYLAFQAYALCAADLNDDGYADVAALMSPATLSVSLWNPATGSFLPRTDYSTSGYGSIQARDVNADGNVDLTFVGFTNSNVTTWSIRVLPGTGGGAFGAVIEYPLGVTSTYPLNREAFAWGDVNGDGLTDLVATVDDAVVTLPGQPGGSFGPPSRSSLGDSFLAPGGLRDLDGDGRLDLVGASWDAVTFAKGNGDGTFGAPAGWPIPKAQSDVSLVNVDNSGGLDLVISGDGNFYSSVPGGVSILRGNGDATFQAPVTLDPAAYTYGHVVRDFDGDGLPDLAVAGVDPQFSGQLAVYRGIGGGAFAAPQLYPAPVSFQIDAYDMNGDGRPDLLMPDSYVSSYVDSARISVYYATGNPASVFGTPQILKVRNPGSSEGPYCVHVGSLDGVAGPDLAILFGGNSGGVVQLFLNNGPGSYYSAIPPFGSTDLALADIDSDGDLDVVLDSGVLRNLGAGQFSMWNSFAVEDYYGGAVRVADMDGDGKLDVVGARNAEVHSYRWNGTSIVESRAFGVIPGAWHNGSLALGDVNGDGLKDAVVTSGTARLTVLLNTPGGEPPPAPTTPGLWAPTVVGGEAGGAVSLSVSAGDADGEAIASLTADVSAAPPGSSISFTPNATNTAGTLTWYPPSPIAPFPVVFHAANSGSASATTYLSASSTGTGAIGTVLWTPTSSQVGTYTLAFQGTGPGGTASATTQVTVTSGAAAATSPRSVTESPQFSRAGQTSATAPTLSAPASVSVPAGQPLGFVVSGSLCSNIAVNAAPPGLTLALDREPAVTAPSQLFAAPGTPLSIAVSASDPDGNGIASLSAVYSLPPGNNAAFTANAQQTAGTFTWTPTAADLGKKFGIVFQAANALVGTAPTLIQVQDSPVSYWRLNGNGTDELGRANLTPGSSPTWVAGKLNLATSMNGTGTGGTLTGSAVPQDGITGPFTFECWFKTSGSVGQTQEILRASTAAGDQWWGFGVSGSPWTGQPLFAVRTSNITGFYFVGPARVDDAQWHHVAVTYSGGTFQMFVDGTAQSSLSQAVSMDVTGGSLRLGIGDNLQTFPFSGLVDEVRIWNRARTQSEIQAAMNVELLQTPAAVTTVPAPLVTRLGQNFPNPFNPVTQVPFQLERAGHVRLLVYDVRGRRVRTLADGDLAAGSHAIRWDGEDDSGRRLASGIYACRLEFDGRTERRLMALVR